MLLVSCRCSFACLLKHQFRPAGRVTFSSRRKSNQKRLPPTSGPACGGVPSLHHYSRGTPRRAIPGPSRLSRHPCRSTPYTTIPLSLLTGPDLGPIYCFAIEGLLGALEFMISVCAGNDSADSASFTLAQARLTDSSVRVGARNHQARRFPVRRPSVGVA